MNEAITKQNITISNKNHKQSEKLKSNLTKLIMEYSSIDVKKLSSTLSVL